MGDWGGLLNRPIIQDCLALDRALSTPWLNYVKRTMDNIKRPKLFTRPADLVHVSKRSLKELCAESYVTSWQKPNDKLITVKLYLIVTEYQGTQPYLLAVDSSHQWFLLIRFRLGVVFRKATFPKMNDWSRTLPLCPCNNRASQNMVHFMFLLNIL
mgnify:CR=1 FL=1